MPILPLTAKDVVLIILKVAAVSVPLLTACYILETYIHHRSARKDAAFRDDHCEYSWRGKALQSNQCEEPDLIRLRAFFAWCCIFTALAVIALWHGIKLLGKALLFPFRLFHKG